MKRVPSIWLACGTCAGAGREAASLATMWLGAWIAGATFLAASILATSAVAQQRPELGYIFPPGGQAGSTVEVQLGGYDFTSDTQFFVLDTRVTLEVLGPPSPPLHPGPPHWFGPRALNSNKPFPIPREVPARLTIPPGMPPGVIHWQAANANGASAMGTFVIAGGLTELREIDCPVVTGEGASRQSESEAAASTASPVRELPSPPLTVSGRLANKEEVDRFRFVASTTGLVTCHLPAVTFGYPPRAVLEVRDDAGQLVADAADPAARGLNLTFAVEAGRSYALTLYDLDYRGDRAMVYRLTLRDAPQVVAALSAAGRRGETQSVRLIGYGVATGQPQLESIEREIVFPQSAEQDVFEFQLETPFGTAAPFPLRLTDLPESVEDKLTDQRLDIPGAVTGTLAAPLAADKFRIAARQGESLSIAVEAAQVGSPLDVSLAVFGADGKLLAENDDLPGTTDAGLMFRAPADGEYWLVVRDLSGYESPSPIAASSTIPTPAEIAAEASQVVHPAAAPSHRLDCVYRLSVETLQPNFRLVLPDRAETVVGAPPVEPPANKRKPRDPTGLLVVEIEREGGFTNAVRLDVAGLPADIAPPGELVIPEGETWIGIPITCGNDASSLAALATVRATSVEGASSEPLRDEAVVLVVPKMKPRAVVRPLYPDGGRTVYRGATYPAPVVVERLEGFDGEVELQMAAHPDRVRQGIIGSDVVVPAGVAQIDFPLFLPEWVQTDRTSRIVLNTVVRIPDGQGQVRQLVNRMDRRITMNVEGAVLKLAADADEFPWGGDQLAIPLRILRTPKLAGPVQIGFAADDFSKSPPTSTAHHERLTGSVESGTVAGVESAGPFRAERQTLDASEQQATLRVTADVAQLAAGEHLLTIEARGQREGHPVISRTSVVVIVPAVRAVSTTTAAATASETTAPGEPHVGQPALHVRIDALLDASLAGASVAPESNDAEFLRRVYLDLAGRIPTVDEARAFLDDDSPGRRAALIDRLLSGPDYPRRMQELFDAMLMERRGGHEDWERFLRFAFEKNLPWDEIARALVRPDADDDNTRGAAYFLTARLVSEGAMAPVDVPGLTRDVGRLLLGVDLQCAQCHDHISISDYTQRDFQGLHVVFEHVETRRDVTFPAVAEKVLAGPKSFMSVFLQEPMQTSPVVPGGGEFDIVTFPKGDEYLVPPDRKTRSPGVPKFRPLSELADRLASADNPLFCRNIVNRLWFVMLGHGLVEPLDLHHRANPASHPELLDLLAREFAAHDLDIRWLMRELALTRAYQRSGLASAASGERADVRARYASAAEKRMQAETLFWSVLVATDSWADAGSYAEDESPAGDSSANDVLAGDATDSSPAVRAQLERAVADSKAFQELRAQFVKTFANSPKEPEIEFEPSVKGALFLMHDERVLRLLAARPDNLIDRLSRIDDPHAVADGLFLAILSRPPTDEDRRDVAAHLAMHESDREAALTDLAWALLAGTEFCVNH